MHFKLVSFVLTSATLIAVGCASENADDSADGAGALSAEDCTPKAEDARATALKACQTANTFDTAACRKPVDDAFAKWQSDVKAAYNAVKDTVDPITGDCKKNVDAMACKDLLSSAGKDFAAAAKDQKACDALRSARETKCDSDASDAIQTALGDDTSYTTLVGQEPQVEATYLAGIVSCDAQSALKTVAAATCPAQAELKKDSAYLACRHQCPNVSGAACTPTDYPGLDVKCGTSSTVSSAFGLFCESGSQCKRTSLCDKYDSAKADADKINKSSGCTTSAGAPGILVPILTFKGVLSATDAGQAPNGVSTICQDLPSTTPTTTTSDAGAPPTTPTIEDAGVNGTDAG